MSKAKLRREFKTTLSSLKNRANAMIVAGYGFVVWLSAAAFNHVGELFFIIFMVLFGIGALYMMSKGK